MNRKLKIFFLNAAYIAGISSTTLGVERLVEAAKLNKEIGAAKAATKEAFGFYQEAAEETKNILREQWLSASDNETKKVLDGDKAIYSGLALLSAGLIGGMIAASELKRRLKKLD